MMRKMRLRVRKINIIAGVVPNYRDQTIKEYHLILLFILYYMKIELICLFHII